MRLLSTWATVYFLTILTCASKALHTPLFGAVNHSIPTLHRSFGTLLPYLPEIASGWSNSVSSNTSSSTLVVTLATPAFKHLLLNFLCYLHHRLEASLHPPGRYLVITSSSDLALWLSERGVIVLLLDRDSHEEAAPFQALRQLGVLLSPTEFAAGDRPARTSMIDWGSLRYQSLMLERSLAISSLVSMLSEANTVSSDLQRPVAYPILHSDEDDYAYEEEQQLEAVEVQTPVPVSKPVGGVLVVDNDAAWYVLSRWF